MKWPDGINSAGAACGIKASGLDLGIVVADEPVAWAGTFTKNAAAAAPVNWSRSLLGKKVRAIVANSGNANACTGTRGQEAVERTARAAATELRCEPDEILVASTGPIGVELPVEKICSALPAAFSTLGKDTEEFSRSIMTTDTAVKVATGGAGEATVVGVAKGAAMIAPNMATMLAFIATDADLDGNALQEGLTKAVRRSFDRISVDACESTNDSVFLLSSGSKAVDVDAFEDALASVCRSLAEQIVRDAEGGSRLMRIQIEGAAGEDEAVSLGRAVAASDLWRAAVNGGDPNWGRVLSAMGSVDRTLDISTVDLSIGPELVFAKGEPCGSLEVAAKAMAEPEFTVLCVLGRGPGSAEILSADLSKEYVALNSEVTT
jgi:glutamate N-acetyltransferase / amino-acid N-acetyltransferase